MQNNQFDTIIIGAGAAGLFCAYTAASRGKKVAILDHSAKLAEKIRISGGGKCNFTNINTNPNSYISQNKHFCISALSRYTQHDFIELLDNNFIQYHEKTLGQLFCNYSSQTIIDLLDNLCQQNNVMRKMSCNIKHINKTNTGFSIETSTGIYTSETLVIATGGLAIPQIGATPFGYNLARDFGHNIVELAPALVPLTLKQDDLASFAPLSGVSFLSEVNHGKITFKENTLITHKGLSGPAILQISSYLSANSSININMLPEINISHEINQHKSSNKLLSNFLQNFLSKRLADSICTLLKLDKPLSQLSKNEIELIENFVHSFKITPNGTQGYKKAEVTRGGIDTTQLSSQTMQSKLVDGLFFIGEVVDVTGWLGGYNFQWAWSSGYVAGISV